MGRIVRLNYDELRGIIHKFRDEGEDIVQLHATLRDRVRDLHKDWQGEAADDFFAEMEVVVLPAVSRLSKALFHAQDVLQKITRTIQEFDEDTKGFFNNDFTPISPEHLGALGGAAGIGAASMIGGMADGRPGGVPIPYPNFDQGTAGGVPPADPAAPSSQSQGTAAGVGTQAAAAAAGQGAAAGAGSGGGGGGGSQAGQGLQGGLGSMGGGVGAQVGSLGGVSAGGGSAAGGGSQAPDHVYEGSAGGGSSLGGGATPQTTQGSGGGAQGSAGGEGTAAAGAAGMAGTAAAGGAAKAVKGRSTKKKK